MHIISLEVLVGKRNEDKNTSLIKDKESHFFLKHQTAISVSLVFSIHPGFPAPQVGQDEKIKSSINTLGYTHIHAHTHFPKDRRQFPRMILLLEPTTDSLPTL